MRSARCLAFLLLATVIVASAAKTQTPPTDRTASKVEEQRQQAELKNLRRQITQARRTTWACQDRLRLVLSVKRTKAGTDVWSLPTSVPYRIWVLDHWNHLAAECSKKVRARTIPNIQDWPMAVRWVQKIYPGTQDWMLAISDREGGWGRWVWYGGGTWRGSHIGNDFLGADTVGGWMQFRFSTFAPYWRQAKEDLIRRGYFIPDFKVPPPGGDPLYAEWLNPMGQALTAGYMRYTGKDGCHWCL